MGISEGIMLGVFVALLYMIYQNTQPHIAVLGRIKDTHYFKNINRFTKDVVTYPQVLILRFDGQLFFGNQRYFKQQFSALIKKEKQPLKHLVIAAAPISYIDATAFEMLSSWMEELNDQGITIHWTGLNGPLRDRFHKKGVFGSSHNISIYSSLDAALNAIQGSDPSEIEKTIALQRNKI